MQIIKKYLNLEEWKKMAVYELSYSFTIILVSMDNWSKSNGSR
jgi:hypothetical protein